MSGHWKTSGLSLKRVRERDLLPKSRWVGCVGVGSRCRWQRFLLLKNLQVSILNVWIFDRWNVFGHNLAVATGFAEHSYLVDCWKPRASGCDRGNHWLLHRCSFLRRVTAPTWWKATFRSAGNRNEDLRRSILTTFERRAGVLWSFSFVVLI